jgi:hypothetical protein
MPRNPNHAVNLAEKIRDVAFNRFARAGDYERYYELVNASLDLREAPTVWHVRDGREIEHGLDAD